MCARVCVCVNNKRIGWFPFLRTEIRLRAAVSDENEKAYHRTRIIIIIIRKTTSYVIRLESRMFIIVLLHTVRVRVVARVRFSVTQGRESACGRRRWRRRRRRRRRRRCVINDNNLTAAEIWCGTYGRRTTIITIITTTTAADADKHGCAHTYASRWRGARAEFTSRGARSNRNRPSRYASYFL